MTTNVITPERILVHLANIERIVSELEACEPGRDTDIARWLKWDVQEIRFQTEYMISSAYEEAIEDGDKPVLKTLFMFCPDYRLKASIALTKMQFDAVTASGCIS